MSWRDNLPEQSLSASGKYNPDSNLAKQYANLAEDGDSRVDDEEGWREIHRDNTPKNAAEYEQMVQKYAKQGFDVKAIDMDGDFAHANFAIKPSQGGGETKPIEYSPEIQEAKERVQTFEQEAWDGTQSENIYGGGNRSLYEGYSDDGGKQQAEAAKSLAQTLADTKKRDILAQLSNKISV